MCCTAAAFAPLIINKLAVECRVAELRQALEGRLPVLPRPSAEGWRQRRPRRSAVQVPPLILAL